MIKGLLLLADGFEETEAVSVHDILTRTHEIALTLASVKETPGVVSSMGIAIKADSRLQDLDLGSYDFLVLPGGKSGVANLAKNETAMSAIKAFHQTEKPIFAICAAPSILGALGYLDGRNYTCFPGFEAGKGHKDEKNPVVVDGDLITGRSMYYTIPFAEAIVKYYLGEDGVKKIYHGTRGADPE